MSGEKRQLTFVDILSVASFLIGVENLEANLTQNDKQDLQRDLTASTERLLTEIHAHLEAQDRKIDSIIKRLEVKMK